MNILIIEDEPTTAGRLKKMLTELSPDYKVEGVIDSVEESISYFTTNKKPDLVFMDIHLADGNSFAIFDQVHVSSPVIFTTAYDQYALKAFKVNSIDYLLKPVKRDELKQSLDKFNALKAQYEEVAPDYKLIAEIMKGNAENTMKRFMVRIGQNIKAINVSDLAYFFVDQRIVYAMLKTGQKYPVDFTMDYLEKNLDSHRFFRINRSFLIDIDAISSMVAYSKSRIKIELTPPCDTEVITSTDRSGPFKDWLSGINS